MALAAETTANALNTRILDSVNRSGAALLSHTRLRGRFSLRLAIGNIRTDETQIRRTWHLLKEKLSGLV